MKKHYLFAAIGLIASAMFAATGNAADSKKIGISSIIENPALIEAKNGLLEVLEERGYKQGKNLDVDYQSAYGNMPTQLQIAKRFAGKGLDAVVAITTPTAQVMAGSVENAPIVFVAVTDPVKAKLISAFEPTGGNITGISDAPPIAQQLTLFKEIMPEMKSIGFLYNPGLDSSLAMLEWIRAAGEKLDVEIVESAAPTTNEIIPGARKLVGKVDAIFIPNDTTILSSVEAVVKVGEESDTPVFAAEPRGVDRGALASVGVDYYQLGRIAGGMVADILSGKNVGEISPVLAYEKLPKFNLAVSKKAALEMGVTLPESVLKRADKIIE